MNREKMEEVDPELECPGVGVDCLGCDGGLECCVEHFVAVEG